MEFISRESRQQNIMLPDCLDDYITDNNSVQVIETYSNSLNLAALAANALSRIPADDSKDLLKLYLRLYKPHPLVATAGNRKQTESGAAVAAAQALPGAQNHSRVPVAEH